MPFRYRLQKILDFRIRKKEEQLTIVQKAQQAVYIAEENIRKNDEEIRMTKQNMRQADPMMYETYDNYLIFLWDKAEKLELIRQEAQKKLDEEKAILVKQTLQEFDFFELIGVCFKYILIFLVGNR